MNEESLKRRLGEELGKPYVDIVEGFKISEDKSKVTYFIPSDKSNERKIGEIITIYDLISKTWFGAKIVEIDRRAPFELDKERNLYGVDDTKIIDRFEVRGKVYENPALVTVELLGMFEETRKFPSKCPTSASILLKANLEDDKETGEPGLRSVIGLATKGLNLGAFSSDCKPYEKAPGEYLLYKLNFGSMTNKHMVIYGGSGSGKTTLLKHLIKQIIHEGYGVLAFDIQGDILQMLTPQEVSDEFSKNFLKQIGDKVGLPSHLKLKVLFPRQGVEVTEREKTIKEYCEAVGADFFPFSLHFSVMNSSSEFADMILGQRSSQAFDLLDEQLPGNHLTLNQFAQMLIDARRGANPRDNMIFIGGSPTPWYTSTVDAVSRILRVLVTKGIFDSGPREPDMFVNNGELVIVYLEHIGDIEARNLYERHVIEQMRVKKTQVQEPGVFIVLDEAHEIIPARAIGGNEEIVGRLAFEFSKVSREGRKYNINLIISTHKPRDIHSVVNDLCDNTVAFKLNEYDCKVVGLPKTMMTQASYLPKGYAFVKSASSDTTPWLQVKFPQPTVYHSDPKPFFDYKIKEIIKSKRDKKIEPIVKKLREDF